MIYVEKEITTNDTTIIQVRIWTACCKRVFLVDKNKQVDLETGQQLTSGMMNSINLAYENFKRDSNRNS